MSEETVNINGTEYPKWVVERAEWVVKELVDVDLELSVEDVIETAVEGIEAERNAIPADPNKPVNAVFGGGGMVFLSSKNKPEEEKDND